jgi:hypothetical protein
MKKLAILMLLALSTTLYSLPSTPNETLSFTKASRLLGFKINRSEFYGEQFITTLHKPNSYHSIEVWKDGNFVYFLIITTKIYNPTAKIKFPLKKDITWKDWTIIDK